jgi:enamine deaminase RidA (YjgF/YER057c/UK114 family)
MPVTLIRPPQLYVEAPYAYASVTARGSLIFTAGACPLDQQGQVVAPGDLAAQTRQCLDNLRVALQASGADFSDIVKSTIFVATADRDDLLSAWSEVAAAFGEHEAPSTLLGVTMLGYRDQLVEIEAVATVPG